MIKDKKVKTAVKQLLKPIVDCAHCQCNGSCAIYKNYTRSLRKNIKLCTTSWDYSEERKNCSFKRLQYLLDLTNEGHILND